MSSPFSIIPIFLTCHGILGGAELFPQFVHIVRMNLLKECAAEPFGLRMVQYGSHRVRHVDDTARLSSHHEQKTISRLQNQMLQFLSQ